MTRPYLKPRNWAWKAPDGTGTPGVGLFHGQYLKAHLTPTEARKLADKLHDMADQLDNHREQEQQDAPETRP